MKRAGLAVALALPLLAAATSSVPLLAAAASSVPLLAAKSDPLAGRVAGPPSRCLELSRVQGPDIIDANTILYRQNGRRIWRATPVGACPGLRPFSRLIVTVYGAQICRNDRFQVLDVNSIIPSAYCRFGSFTPYDKR